MLQNADSTWGIGYEPEGRVFESPRAHHVFIDLLQLAENFWVLCNAWAMGGSLESSMCRWPLSHWPTYSGVRGAPRWFVPLRRPATDSVHAFDASSSG